LESQARKIAYISVFAALTATGAMISLPLPFSSVPFTLQVLFVLLSGLVLGPFDGALSQLVYLLMGAVGLPVFAQFSGGLGVILGKTGGYLIGFVFASFVAGLLGRGSNFLRLFLASVLALLMIYFFGVFQLSLVLNLGFKKAFIIGALPFIPFDLIKALMAVFLALKLKKASLLKEQETT